MLQFAYRRSPDQDRSAPAHHRVVIVGAGPVGLTLALDLAQHGIAVVLLDDAARIGEGSRAICFAKRTLDIWDRLGVAAPMLEKGVRWQRGRVFQRDGELYHFDLQPAGAEKMPAFINLQQYYVEAFLAEAVGRDAAIDLRWSNRVTAVEPRSGGAALTVATPEGDYPLTCDWLIACDGARSPCRNLLGLAFAGEVFDDQFLIADVRMQAPFPTERWFWFDPPFHPGQSALLHKQPDDVWRIDLQLSPAADADYERRPEVVTPRIARMLGTTAFELVWTSVYRFQCRRLKRFVHGRIVFAGDAAHQVSPFGARGANSGVQDAENLAWKLARVLAGTSPEALVATYDIERGQAADQNIGHSTRATDFIAPRSPGERTLRNAALALASTSDFARRFVNSGRLSTASWYDSPLSSPTVIDDRSVGNAVHANTEHAGPQPGEALPDAPLVRADGSAGYLLEMLGGAFALIAWPDGSEVAVPNGVRHLRLGHDFEDHTGLVAARLGLAPGSACLVRPDQHVAARLPIATTEAVTAAFDRATGGLLTGEIVP